MSVRARNRPRIRSFAHAALACVLAFAPGCDAGRDGAVPTVCGAEVNRAIGALIARGDAAPVDGVLVCGTTFAASRPLRRGRNGAHQLLPLRVPLPGGTSALVEVVTNDDLDGRVTAPRGVTVFALGQYFATTARQRPFVAGVHDVHCATHRGAVSGWVVVDGHKAPAHC